jgi:hypothetical protein
MKMLTQDDVNAVMDSLTEEQKKITWKVEEDDSVTLTLDALLLNFANAVIQYTEKNK